jgi:hypothetical protein
MSATSKESTALLEIAEKYLRNVTACIDRLTVLGAADELRRLAVRLQELSFRAGLQ